MGSVMIDSIAICMSFTIFINILSYSPIQNIFSPSLLLLTLDENYCDFPACQTWNCERPRKCDNIPYEYCVQFSCSSSICGSGDYILPSFNIFVLQAKFWNDTGTVLIMRNKGPSYAGFLLLLYPPSPIPPHPTPLPFDFLSTPPSYILAPTSPLPSCFSLFSPHSSLQFPTLSPTLPPHVHFA